jgi:hypothetical protein
VYDSLKAGAVAGNAGTLLAMLIQNVTTHQERLVHPRDGFGRIVAWMWSHDRDEAMLFLADYLAELRQHQYLASHLTPSIGLEELLSGLRLAWPSNTPESDYDTFVDQARREVAGYYGSQI